MGLSYDHLGFYVVVVIWIVRSFFLKALDVFHMFLFKKIHYIAMNV